MRIEAFQSDKGDCLLLTGTDGKRVLVDGGMRASYEEHVAPALGVLAAGGEDLELVYVSHIDRDHISGVLQLMDDTVAWKVRDFQHGRGNTGFPEPRSARPPAIKRIWHNAFHDLVPENTGPIGDAIAASAAVLEGGLREEAESQRDLDTSIKEGIELSYRVAPEHLGIPLNEEFGGKLAMVRDQPQTVELGSLKLTVIGPFEADLEKLRQEWNDWLDTNEPALDRLRGRMRADAERLGLGEVAGFRLALEQRASELGDRDDVTTPNLASLMLFAEDGGRTLLLTGDGHSQDILNGLKAAGRLDNGRLHVDVLKVQHHGSEKNIEDDFTSRVTADHYVFCANGEHENPDLRVVDLIARSRFGAGDDRPFKLWFNSSSTVAARKEGRDHMALVEADVAALAAESGGRMTSQFLDGSSFEVA